MPLRFRLLPVAMLLAAPAAAQAPLPGVPVPGIPTRDILHGTLEAGREALPDIDPKLLEIQPECTRWLLQQRPVPAPLAADLDQPLRDENPTTADIVRSPSPAGIFDEEGCALYAESPQRDGQARLGKEDH